MHSVAGLHLLCLKGKHTRLLFLLDGRMMGKKKDTDARKECKYGYTPYVHVGLLKSQKQMSVMKVL